MLSHARPAVHVGSDDPHEVRVTISDHEYPAVGAPGVSRAGLRGARLAAPRAAGVDDRADECDAAAVVPDLSRRRRSIGGGGTDAAGHHAHSAVAGVRGGRGHRGRHGVRDRISPDARRSELRAHHPGAAGDGHVRRLHAIHRHSDSARGICAARKMSSSLLLAVAGFIAGAMNAVAGGGTFVTLPALTLAGLPPTIANASSTVALFPGTLASSCAYRRDVGALESVSTATLLALSVAGGLIGALLLLSTPERAFTRIIPWLLLTATIALAA